jgi:hypothetical protein
VSLAPAREVWTRARASGFYSAEDLKLLADKLSTGQWTVAEADALVTDAEWLVSFGTSSQLKQWGVKNVTRISEARA